MEPRTSPRVDLRIGDAERRRAVADLQRHYVDGRLSADELGERTARAYAARTRGDLVALLLDLPPSPGAAPAGDGRRHPVRGQRPADVRAHAGSYVLVMALLVAIWLLTTPGGYFWPIWPMLGWGVGVASHGLARSCGPRRHARHDEALPVRPASR